MTFRTFDNPVPAPFPRPVEAGPRPTAIVYDLPSWSPRQPARLEAHWRVQKGDGRLVCRWQRASFASSKRTAPDDSALVIELLPSTGSFSFCPAGAVCSGGSLPSHAL